MYFTASAWSHITVMGRHGQLYDMTTDGFRIHHFSNYLDGSGYILVRRPNQPFDVDSAIAYANSCIGTKFNWFGVIRLGYIIVLGAHPSYNFRLSVDVFLIAAPFLCLGLLKPFLGWCVFAAMLCYCVTVIFNIPARRRMARNMFPPSQTG